MLQNEEVGFNVGVIEFVNFCRYHSSARPPNLVAILGRNTSEVQTWTALSCVMKTMVHL